MPELAEVEFYRRRWAVGHGDRVRAVETHPGKRVFRGTDAGRLARGLAGAVLLDSAAAAKQMLFRFDGGRWLGIHLGMSGELRVEPAAYAARPHDHLRLRQDARTLVFTDPRMFGGVRYHEGGNPPDWWTLLAPPILSHEFTPAALAAFLRRRARAPLKAVLLMQERFPGVGNWMADEILWRARLGPRRAAGKVAPAEARSLWRHCRLVCRGALRHNAGVGGPMPAVLNEFMPATWLFNHRWRPGGRCPRCAAGLRHAEVGGRTTCWCPRCQPR
jgi:formamidopyrimidine-DNA glycosylase